jgi:hypothetical protein
VLPLCLYHGNTFIEPKDANKELKQALVEIYFGLKHYYMKKDHFNSFQAVIQQINILKADESTTKSVYKRTSAREGPIDFEEGPSTKKGVSRYERRKFLMTKIVAHVEDAD